MAAVIGNGGRKGRSTKAFAPPQQQFTFDSFRNFTSKVGRGTGNQGDASHYAFNPVTRNRMQMDWVYRGSWIGGRVVDIVAIDMTREGAKVMSSDDPTKIAEFNKEVERLQVWPQLCMATKWARLYGGALAFMMIDGQNPSTPLRLETLSKGQFKGLLPIDRWLVQPSLQDLIEDYGPDYGKPKFYDTLPDTGGMPRMKIHYSRVIRIPGVELPYWQRISENMWEMSVLERMWDRMISFDSTTLGAAQLVYKAHLRTLQIDGLRDILGGNLAAQQGLLANVEMIRFMQTNEGLTLIDSKDKFEAHAYTFTGLDNILMQFSEQLSGATDIPLVRLFGQSPKGFSTGDTDLRNYYDSVHNQRVSQLGPGVNTMYRVIYINKFGKEPPKDWSVEFGQLWKMTEPEKAADTGTTTTAINTAFESNLISRSTGMKELKEMSKRTGTFTNITDEDIEEAKNDPPPSPEALGLEVPEGPMPEPPRNPDGSPNDKHVPPGTPGGGAPGGKPEASKPPGKTKDSFRHMLARWLMRDDGKFEEHKHPRGQPKNAGQFGPGGGGAGGKPAAKKATAEQVVAHLAGKDWTKEELKAWYKDDPSGYQNYASQLMGSKNHATAGNLLQDILEEADDEAETGGELDFDEGGVGPDAGEADAKEAAAKAEAEAAAEKEKKAKAKAKAAAKAKALKEAGGPFVKAGGGKLGSNEGGVYTQGGVKHYVKFYKDQNQAKTEVATAQILNAMGIKTTNPSLEDVDGKKGVATQWQDLEKVNWPEAVNSLSKKQRVQLASMYYGAVLTKNWDVLGLDYSNIAKNKNGDLVQLDTGGSLSFRAQGKPKEYGPDINEATSLMDPGVPAGRVFSMLKAKDPSAFMEAKSNLTAINMPAVNQAFKDSKLPNADQLQANFMQRAVKIGSTPSPGTEPKPPKADTGPKLTTHQRLRKLIKQAHTVGPVEASKFIAEVIKCPPPPLSAGNMATVEHYVGGSGGINGALRSHKGDLTKVYGSTKAHVEGLDAMMTSARDYHIPITVTRGVPKDILASYKKGMTYTDHAFMSTSFAKAKADDFGGSSTHMEITMPKGFKFLSVPSYAAATKEKGHTMTGVAGGEAEAILPRETSVVITKITKEGGRTTYHCKAVGSITQPVGTKWASTKSKMKAEKKAATAPSSTNPGE